MVFLFGIIKGVKINEILKLLCLPLYFFIVGIFVINFNLGYTISLLLYFLVPSIYFSLRKPEIIKKVSFHSLIFGFLAVFIFDYIAHVSGSWYVPSELGIRVFGAFPIEEILWSILFFYLIISSYEFFFKKHSQIKVFYTNTRYMIMTLISLFVIFFSILFLNKNLLVIDYFYIYMLIGMMILPSLVIFYFHQRYIKDALLLSIVFMISFLFYEYSALITKQWFFNGSHYIGWVPLLNIKMPIEELLFMIVSVPGVISFYELFTKDRKQEVSPTQKEL